MIFVKCKSILYRVLYKEGKKISTYGRVTRFWAEFSEQTVKILISIKSGNLKTVYGQEKRGGGGGGALGWREESARNCIYTS